jgi:mRNA-degrading endonuclease toxin of MazEF toxin-antitoxin module
LIGDLAPQIGQRPHNSIIAPGRVEFLIAVGVTVGVEIDGKHTTFERPAVILRKLNNQMTWILPVTSQEKDSPFYQRFTYGDKTYYAALTQLRTVSTKRFLRKIGMISPEDFARMQSRVASIALLNERSPAQGGAPRSPKP